MHIQTSITRKKTPHLLVKAFCAPRIERAAGASASRRVCGRLLGLAGITLTLLLGANLDAEAETKVGAQIETHGTWTLDAGWNLLPPPKDPDGSLFRRYETKDLSIWGRTENALAWQELQAFEGQKSIWVFAEKPTTIDAPRATRSGDQSTNALGWYVLSVERSTMADSLNVARLVEWETTTEEYRLLAGDDFLEPGRGYWAYRDEADAAPDASYPPPPPVVPGAFEAPSPVGPDVGSVALPKVALSAQTRGAMAHLAYIKRGEKPEGPRLHYLRSHQAARPNSFEVHRALANPGPDWQITDLAIAARDQKLSIAWIQTLRDAPTPKNELWVRLSENAGQSFLEPQKVADGPSWKRSPSVGFDRLGHHHLVWNEAHKVYYLKDLHGEPENVFDVVVREKNNHVVDYLLAYKEKSCDRTSACACIAYVNEYYSYALVEDSRTGAPHGPYVERTEEAFVYNPSLELGDHHVSIVARQDRMWDNRPVPNPAWREAYGKSAGCDKEGTRKPRKGFMRVWQPRRHPTRPHALGETKDRDGHYYLHDGTWHEQDQIRVAQRPLVLGTWSNPQKTVVEVSNWPISSGLLTWTKETQTTEQGWSQGSWHKNRLQSWRLSVVTEVGSDPHSGTTSRPKLITTPEGKLLALYEDGPSDNPNMPGANPIWLSVSEDGGNTWMQPSRVGQGYVPDAAVTDEGEVGIVYYQASGPPGPAEPPPAFSKIQVARSFDLKKWTTAPLNMAPPQVIHFETHGPGADTLIGVPSLAAVKDLFVATWIRGALSTVGGDRIVTSRASRLVDPSHTLVAPEKAITTGRKTRLTVTAVNQYDMRINHHGPVALKITPNSGSGPAGSADHSPHQGRSGHGTASGAPTDEPLVATQDLRLVNGQATLFTQVHHAEVQLTVSGPENSGLKTTLVSLDAYTDDVDGNYKKAVDARDGLVRTKVGNDDRMWTYQVEYQPAPENMGGIAQTEGYQNDAHHLAHFERVWAYTQGIALAQLSKNHDLASIEKAQGMARFLCDHAKPGTNQGEDVLLGWPFSWNTSGDAWADARLVTGANAWAIHGLGVFVASKAFLALEALEQDGLRQCYQEALKGLEQHRQTVIAPETGTTVSLMTAGWTTLGLEHAEHPSSLSRPRAGPSAGTPYEKDPQIQWGYYSVLDAMGYSDFDEERPPTIKRVRIQSGTESLELEPLILTEADLRHFKTVVRATNVVTEHNLDVLSVLNHAIDHREAAGIADVEHLVTWRNQLRDGIFYALWDAEGWKEDLQNTLTDPTVDPKRKARILAALEENALGRVITGGQLSGTHPPYHFTPSKHVAIDNCSWLSLSVDYKDLAPDSVYVRRLAQCLAFTELHFTKRLPFQKKSYYGAHYFQNTFRDPYIAPSERQESSFHLEATTGLILGLHRFGRAYPSKTNSHHFRAESRTLWDGVQTFVTDFGFPYSSQRIQDLSTLLSSSTAAIWFIDVYNELSASDARVALARLPAWHAILAHAQLAQADIPGWIRNNAGWWANEEIGDKEFIQGIQYLIGEGILKVSPPEGEGTSSPDIPSWVKNNARWWSEGGLSDTEFLQAIQYLVNEGILSVGSTRPNKDIPNETMTEVLLEGIQGQIYTSEELEVASESSWTAEWPEKSWLQVSPSEGSEVIRFSVDADRALFLSAEVERHEEVVRLWSPEGEWIASYRVVLEQKPVPHALFDGWHGGKFVPMQLSVTAPQAWRAQWQSEWLKVSPAAGPPGEAALKVMVELDVAFGLGPRVEPYEDILKVVGEDGTRIAAMRVTLVQRGTKASTDGGSFDMPPGLSWCVPEDHALALGEATCRPGTTHIDACPDGGCSDKHSIRLSWTLNGAPFSGFEPNAALGMANLGTSFELLRETAEAWVDMETGKAIPTPAGLLFRDDLEIAYVGESKNTQTGRVTTVVPESDHRQLSGRYETIAQRFDDIVSAEAKFLGVESLPDHHTFILPHALFLPAVDGVTGRISEFALFAGGFTTRAGIYLPMEGAEVAGVPNESAFAHEYVHWAFDRPPLRAAFLEPDTDAVGCLEEGLAELLPHHLGLVSVSDLDGGEIFSDHSECSGDEDDSLSYHFTGYCIMWHLQQSGYFAGDAGDAFVRNLYFPERPIDFDTCALKDKTAGDGYLVYLTEAFSKATGQREDLTPALKNMGINHSGSYERALEHLGLTSAISTLLNTAAPRDTIGPENLQLAGIGLRAPPKTKTKTGRMGWSRGLYNGFKSMLNMEPEAAALLAPITVTTGFTVSLASENDVALETMVTLNGPPAQEWIRVGTVAPNQVMHEVGPNTGVYAFFYDETQIREFGHFTTSSGVSEPFDDHKVYAFDLRDLPDLLPLEQISGDGNAGVAGHQGTEFLKTNPENTAMGVFVLDTETDRTEMVDLFLSRHLWWQHVLNVAAFIPGDGSKNAWLRTMRSMFLGWFFDDGVAALLVRGAPSGNSYPVWWNPSPTPIRTLGASPKSPNPEDEAYWFEITQKPVYWYRDRGPNENEGPQRPAPPRKAWSTTSMMKSL